ncbi:MAG TPA: protease pro-enzyme activation domain-containing protein [Candidatus Elarobacter sp.]
MSTRLAAVAAMIGVLAAGCSGSRGAGTMLPGVSNSAGTSSVTVSPRGAHSTRGKSAVTASPGWVATETSAMAISGASDLGALSPTQPIDVVLGLQMQNVDAVKSLIASGQTIDESTFVAQYAPTSAQVSAAVSYLQSQGFTNVAAEPNNMLVLATASAAVVQKAFNTSLHSFSLGGQTFFANTQPAFVPTALGGNVVAVLGLTNFAGLHASLPTQPAPAGLLGGTFDASGNPTPDACTKNVNTTTGAPVCPRFYDPATYSIAYDVGSTAPARNAQIAIFTVGNPAGAIADFRDNEKRFGMPQAPLTVVNVEPPTADVSGQGEWTLDLTYSQALSYQPRDYILYNAATFSFKDLTVSLNRWASANKAKVMNASVGGCEVFPYQSGDMLVGDMILVEAAAQGQTLFASTGDTGGYCGVGGVPPNGGVGGVPMVEYPAASPYAVAVGGTDLFSNVDGTYLGEDAWQSGGGGLSQFEYAPSWESPAQPVGTTPAGLTFRGLPDVAMDAGLETGALLWQSGVEYITGGTSLASPLAAGTYARMQSLHGNRLPFAPISLYRTFTSSAATQIGGPPETELIGPFHDILSGTNGLYTALPKYDYTTGLGSLDVARLATALQ